MDFLIGIGLRLATDGLTRLTCSGSHYDSSIFDNTDFKPDHVRFGPQLVSISGSGYICIDGCKMEGRLPSAQNSIYNVVVKLDSIATFDG